jgi:hypothetical protein
MKVSGFFSRVMRNINLLDRMMAELHVRDGLASLPNGGKVLRQAAIRCITCRQTDACSAWLAADGQRSKTPMFCGNRHLFEQLKL